MHLNQSQVWRSCQTISVLLRACLIYGFSNVDIRVRNQFERSPTYEVL